MAAARNATAATPRAVIPDVTNIRWYMLTTPLRCSRAVVLATSNGCRWTMHRCASLGGNPAIVGREADRPEALRPRLSTGLPCFTLDTNYRGERSHRQECDFEPGRDCVTISATDLFCVPTALNIRRRQDRPATYVSDRTVCLRCGKSAIGAGRPHRKPCA
jgi:hypothetical protein